MTPASPPTIAPPTARRRAVPPGLVLALTLPLVLMGGLAAGFMLSRLVPNRPAGNFLNTASVVRQVQTLSDLVTVKYVMEKVVVLEDVKWYGENRVLMVAHGVVKAGLPLSEIVEGDIKISGQRIEIRLPRAQIFDAYLNDQQTQIIERSTGLLRQFDKDLEQTARKQAVDDIRRAARTSGILRDAAERGRMQLELLLRQLGFNNVRFVE